MIHKIQNLFNKNKPRFRVIYAVDQGTYKGEFFLYMEKKKDEYVFLSLPDKHIRYVPTKEFKLAITNKIITPVEEISKTIFNICKLQFEKIKLNYEVTNNRQQQPTLPNILHKQRER